MHHYSYILDLCALKENADTALQKRVHAVNQFLSEYIFFSTQASNDYDKILDTEQFRRSKKYFKSFLTAFMSVDYLSKFVGLGFADINDKEKEINSLTQTVRRQGVARVALHTYNDSQNLPIPRQVFYSTDFMSRMANRQSYEFEKECINQMSRSTLRKYSRRFEGGLDVAQTYNVHIRIGHGHTYSKYNTLMHFLNVVECYWRNPDLNNIQVFGKDIRVLLTISSQKIFFDKGHDGCYLYGPIETASSYNNQHLDLAVATSVGHVVPVVCQQKRSNTNQLLLVDRVYEFNYLRRILVDIFTRAETTSLKTENEVLNLCLLSLMLDFGLYREHVGLLNLSFLRCLQHKTDTQELQVEIASLIYEFDRKHTEDSVTRGQVQELLFETSYKFLVNKDFSVQSQQFKLIRMLNSDPDYQSYVLLVKIYMSLCQINKSVEVDYYKIYCDSVFRIIIPHNYSKRTSDYLDEVTKRYTFSELDGIMRYDDLPVFDLRPQQPEINLYKVRFDSATAMQSMVKYIEISNAFHVLGSDERYLVFIADNVLLIEAPGNSEMTILINKIAVDVATIFLNETISFVPCFKYADSEDVVLFASRNIHYMIDQGGQFCTDYYGMKHELVECIRSEEIITDLNDEHVFKSYALSELLTESKTVLYGPHFLLQVSNRQQLINLLDYALYVRNVSFFILVLFYLRRGSVALEFVAKERDVTKISGPWLEAILYVLNRATSSTHYDSIFERQFFDLNQHKDMPLVDFIEVLCGNFTKYQRFTEDGEYEIVPRANQKEFLRQIICSDTPLHFSAVGSGKTKVILPLLCQIFLSNNAEAHRYLARGGRPKGMLVILVPEHLVSDARSQLFRYCLNLNFREEYRVYDDIFALLHKDMRLGGHKQIFVTSFNLFKKALTYDAICAKLRPYREGVLVVADEVDDFLGMWSPRIRHASYACSMHSPRHRILHERSK